MYTDIASRAIVKYNYIYIYLFIYSTTGIEEC